MKLLLGPIALIIGICVSSAGAAPAVLDKDVATLPPSTIASLPITSQTSAADVPHSSSPSPRSTELPTTESSVSSQDSASSQSRTGLATSSVSAVQTPSSTPLIASTSLQSPSPSVTSDFSGVASSVATTPVATISSTPQSSASSATAIPSVSSAISLSSSSGATRGSLSSSVLTTSTGPISSSSMSASSIIPTSSSEAAQTSVPPHSASATVLSTGSVEASTSSGGPSSSAGSSTSVAPAPTVGPAEKQIYLDQHNAVRRRFNAPPLIWSDDLQSKAQSYAERCELRHSDGANGPVGENLAAATGVFDTTSAVNLFVRDMANFDPAQFVFSHFTQVVWKSTTQLGCGVALCDNIFPARKGKATYHVCLYDPVGNVIGEEKENLPL